jgi:hypothetical protein
LVTWPGRALAAPEETSVAAVVRVAASCNPARSAVQIVPVWAGIWPAATDRAAALVRELVVGIVQAVALALAWRKATGREAVLVAAIVLAWVVAIDPVWVVAIDPAWVEAIDPVWVVATAPAAVARASAGLV